MDTTASSDQARRDAFHAALADVYEPLQRYLGRRCAPADADEVLNDVLLTIWRHLDDLPSDRHLPWTYGVARRCLANHRRGTVRRLDLADKAARTAAIGAGNPGSDWTSEADAALHDAMERLSDDDREIVRLWAWERLEPREIAEVLESSANAVSVRLNRIRRRLQEEISRKDRAPAGHERVDGHEEGER